MRQIGFYGSSDDLAEIEGYRPGEPDEVCNTEGHFAFEVVTPAGEGLQVFVDCRINGCWSVGVGQLEEGIPLPTWPMHMRAYHYADRDPYSVRLDMDVPDDAVISLLYPEDDED